MDDKTKLRLGIVAGIVIVAVTLPSCSGVPSALAALAGLAFPTSALSEVVK